MLRRDITYEDFNGQTVTETLYFNLTKTEIVELNVKYDGGLQGYIQGMIDSKDNKSLISEVKSLVLLSYGIKSDDGKRFIKNDQLREEFSQTAAFDALFMDLATNDTAAANFIKGIVPADLSKEIEKELSVVPTMPPVPKRVPPVPPNAS